MKKLIIVMIGIFVLSGCTFQGINKTHSDQEQTVDNSRRH